MTSAESIEKHLNEILDKVAVGLDLKNYTFDLNLNVLKGDGFLGEFYKVSILDNVRNEKLNLAVKKAPEDEKKRGQFPIDAAYRNEIYFYAKLFPVLDKFQKEKGMKAPFDLIPGYYDSIEEAQREIIALEDITSAGFRMREKDLLIDDKHARLIFRTYGRFHALSFAFKDQKPEEFDKLKEPLVEAYDLFVDRPTFPMTLKTITRQAIESLDSVKDAHVLQKCEKYYESCIDILKESTKYKGRYSGIMHGDCWSNNMMFKYQDTEDITSTLESMKLIDFQMVRVGSPVCDLSYFFYTGGSKQLFDKLELYLDLYYESFSECAKELGSNPDKLLPRRILAEHWKQYAKFGMLMSFLLARVKLMSKEDAIKLSDSAGNETVKKELLYNNTNREFNKRVRDILMHMYEIDAL